MIEVCLNDKDWIEVNKHSVKKIFNDTMKRLLLVCDEMAELLQPNKVKTTEGKEEDAMKAEIAANLASILQLGRSAGIHCICCTQRPDSTIISGSMKNNTQFRMMCGRPNSTASMMCFDSTIATTINGDRKGAGMVASQGGTPVNVQYYYEEVDWIYDYFEKRGLNDKGYAEDSETKLDDIELEGTIDLANTNDSLTFEFDGNSAVIDKRQDQHFEEV